MPDGGRVVSIGSIAADKGAESYGAAKAALSSWNIGLARELGGRGITANVVSPGYIGETVWFLSSPEASQITGQTVSVNGGEQPTR